MRHGISWVEKILLEITFENSPEKWFSWDFFEKKRVKLDGGFTVIYE